MGRRGRAMSELIRLFDLPPSWEELWRGMPEFVMGDETPFQRVVVNFASEEDVRRFAEITGVRVTPRSDSIWFPAFERDRASDWVYIDD